MLPLPRADSLARMVSARDGNFTILSQLDFISRGLLGGGSSVIDDVDLVSHDYACVIRGSSVASTELRILARFQRLLVLSQIIASKVLLFTILRGLFDGLCLLLPNFVL